MNRSHFNVAILVAALSLTVALSGCAAPSAATSSEPAADPGPYTAEGVQPLVQTQAQAQPKDDGSISGLDLDQYARDMEFLKSRDASSKVVPDESLDANQAPQGSGRSDRKVIWLNTRRSEPESVSANASAGDDDASGPTDEGPEVVPVSNTQRPPVVSMQNLLVPFKGQLARQAADSSTPLREHMVSAAMLMLGGEDPLDPDSLYDLTDSEREVYKAYQAHFVALRELWDKDGDVKAIRESAHQFLDGLSKSPGLRLNDFKLCSKIVNFGLYDEVKATNFQAMQATPVLTYVEIENFSSQPGADGTYITRLKHELELYTERDGTLVYAWPALPAEDRCGRIRRDFFLPRQISLPANLSTGRYRLKIRITDEQSQQQAEAVLPITIIAGGNWADNR